jgi:hypothetical protein
MSNRKSTVDLPEFLKNIIESNKDNFNRFVKAVPAIARVGQRYSVVNGASFQ